MNLNPDFAPLINIEKFAESMRALVDYEPVLEPESSPVISRAASKTSSQQKLAEKHAFNTSLFAKKNEMRKKTIEMVDNLVARSCENAASLRKEFLHLRPGKGELQPLASKHPLQSFSDIVKDKKSKRCRRRVSESRNCLSIYLASKKIENTKNLASESLSSPANTSECVSSPLTSDQVVLEVAFYHSKKFLKLSSFKILGSQYLTELKDVFTCSSDLLLPTLDGNSGFFFFENVFYNDMRNPSNKNYSATILEWVNQESRYTQPGLGIFSTQDMASVRFQDIHLRLNFPYVFCHQGDCEHIVVFESLRMFNSHIDDSDIKHTPCVFFRAKM
eukprot:Sdes_comp19942_c0_seq2m12425